MTGLVKALSEVASFLHADSADVVPVVNVTSAVNSVVDSLQLQPGDLLLMTNATYPAVCTIKTKCMCMRNSSSYRHATALIPATPTPIHMALHLVRCVGG